MSLLRRSCSLPRSLPGKPTSSMHAARFGGRTSLEDCYLGSELDVTPCCLFLLGLLGEGRRGGELSLFEWVFQNSPEIARVPGNTFSKQTSIPNRGHCDSSTKENFVIMSSVFEDKTVTRLQMWRRLCSEAACAPCLINLYVCQSERPPSPPALGSIVWGWQQ